MSQLKYKNVEAQFEIGRSKSKSKSKSKVSSIEQAAFQLPQHPEITSKLESLRRIADVSPRAAIMRAWVFVEDASGRLGFVQGTSIPRVNPHLFVEELVHLGKLRKGSDSVLDQMRKLRNQAAHLPDFKLNQDEADRYLQLAAQISDLILNVEG